MCHCGPNLALARQNTENTSQVTALRRELSSHLSVSLGTRSNATSEDVRCMGQSLPTDLEHRVTSMKQTLLYEKYPIFTLEVDHKETSFESVDQIVDYFRDRIEAQGIAKFLAVYDHYAHTKSLGDTQVSEDILAAKIVVFCFGIGLPVPRLLAVRPQSVGVAQTRRGFLVTFMEAPMPVANSALESWTRALLDRPAS